MRTNLKNQYFSRLANNINLASEARKVEEEFRLCKNYTMSKTTEQQLIINDKLNNFFQDHFKENDIEIEPEVLNPEHYPHILPPDNQ